MRQFDPLVDEDNGIRRTTISEWSRRYDWKDRAGAWDDRTHRLADAQRLEAIRTLHDTHARAGRAIFTKALQALSAVGAEEIPPHTAARLLEIGARLERDTLVVSVEEMQGMTPPPAEDPWETIARELDALPGT